MRQLNISSYTSRFDKNKKVKVSSLSWRELVERLTKSKKTRETFSEFQAMASLDKLAIKDTGWFVGGLFDPPLRKSFNLVSRSLLVLDLDHLESWDIEEIKATYGKYAYLVHSSHSHSAERPRLRLVIPLTRDVTPEEYEPLSRLVANMLDMDMFDKTTHQFSRIMFWPSHASDGEVYLDVNDGEWLDPDHFLDTLESLDAFGEWPSASDEQSVRPSAARAQDPFTKPGPIGAFNRAYSIPEAIETFDLPYEESGQGDGRYTYTTGTSADGAVYYEDDGHLFSHHESDPAHGNHNAWDLVRLHRFGDDGEAFTDTPLFKRPSMQRMSLLAARDPEVQREIAGEMFDDISGDEDCSDVLRLGSTSAAEHELGGDRGTSAAVPAGQPDGDAGGDAESSVERVEHAPLSQITFISVMEMIEGFQREHDTTIAAQSTQLLEELAVASLPEHETDMCVQAFIAYANRNTKSGLTKIGMKKSLKELKKALSSRKGGDGELVDIQVEFLDTFLERYYAKGAHLRRTGKQFWVFNGTHWSIRSDEYIQGQLFEMLADLRTNSKSRKESRELAAAVGENQTSSIFSGLWMMFQGRATHVTESTYSEKDPMGLLRTRLPKAINCKNGTIDFRADGKWRKRPADPEDMITSCVNVKYDRDAECPVWDAFCETTFSLAPDPRETQRHLEELMGYTLSQSRNLRAWVLLYGGTGTGKSTVVEVMSSLLGEGAKNMPMSNYGGSNNHASAGLVGKQMLIDDDFKAADILNDGFLKSISEEKRLEANPKGKDEYPFVARCVPFIITNNAPATRDSSAALADRALVFPFDHQIPYGERDTELGSKLGDELQGIFARCVRAYGRLVARGQWAFSQACTAAWEKWVEQSNPINIFIAECLDESPKEYVKSTDVWGAFQLWWSQETGRTGDAGRHRSKFYTALEQALERPRVRHSSEGLIWRGWKLDKKFITTDSEAGEGDF